jgi:dTDP-4-dehydrorhamnose reductase
MDLLNVDEVRRVIRAVRPRLIVNAAAFTAVDLAESEQSAAHSVNAVAPTVMAEEAARSAAVLIHFSTDYVFDGAKAAPYEEGDTTNPLNVYGRTKLLGEQGVLASGAHALIFRLGWVYDLHRKNFVTTIRRLAQERDRLRVVADQVGVPTWTGSAAACVGRVVSMIVSRGVVPTGQQSASRGIYHLSGTGSTSWADFAREILRTYPPSGRAHVTVESIATADYPTPAARPSYTVLSSGKLERATGIVLPEWREQLARCLADGLVPASSSSPTT